MSRLPHRRCEVIDDWLPVARGEAKPVDALIGIPGTVGYLLVGEALRCVRRRPRMPDLAASAVPDEGNLAEQNAKSQAGLRPGQEDRTRSVMDAVLGGLWTGCGPVGDMTSETAGQSP
ncbi:hypothetical protein SHKM778_16060 [Streptomyces sp. KM77-8]|uniref:Uncharacterized protein n=1 Tax=Streptomyces haneummycinicus TaxID=3074435 RepID=A0AAT9HCW9_9ACTN